MLQLPRSSYAALTHIGRDNGPMRVARLSCVCTSYSGSTVYLMLTRLDIVTLELGCRCGLAASDRMALTPLGLTDSGAPSACILQCTNWRLVDV